MNAWHDRAARAGQGVDMGGEGSFVSGANRMTLCKPRYRATMPMTELTHVEIFY